MANKYLGGKIYQITDATGTDVYIGSTTQILCKRFANHKSAYQSYKAGKANKVASYDIFDKYGLNGCRILLVENFPCNSKEELMKREGEVIKAMACVNKVVPGRTKKEYNDEHKEEAKAYYQANKEKILMTIRHYKGLEQTKEQRKKHNTTYYMANKEAINQRRKEIYKAKKLNASL